MEPSSVLAIKILAISSGVARLSSIRCLPALEMAEKDLGVDATGPEPFAAVAYKLQQQVSSAAIHALVDELKNLSLHKELGQEEGKIFGE
jgi:hypothetical protein